MKTLHELRSSEFHQELGQKLLAAFLAQQQGISLNTALKKVEGPVCDQWLMVAECALQAHNATVEKFLSGGTGRAVQALDYVIGRCHGKAWK